MQREQLEKLTNEKLVEFIHERLANIAFEYIAIAAALAILESRKFDTRSLKIAGAKFLILMAKGLLAPSAYAMFQGTEVMKKIVRLPFAEQEKLAQTGEVLVYDREGGKNTQRLRSIRALGRQQINMVFGYGVVRNLQEQQDWYLEKQLELDTEPKKNDKRPRYNPKSDVFTYGRTSMPAAVWRSFVKRNRHLFE